MIEQFDRKPVGVCLTQSRPENVLRRSCRCGRHTPDGTCPACTKKQEPGLQRSAVSGHNFESKPSLLHQAIGESGRPLDSGMRGQMEEYFGHDFGHVRVHTGDTAAEAAGSVNASAFTFGRDIVFGASQYAPYTLSGQQLLTHELTHVVHQHGNSGPMPSQFEVNAPNDAYEREADLAARNFGSLTQPAVSAGGAGRQIQRRNMLDSIAGLFAGETFDDSTLQSYLTHLDTTGHIEDFNESDNKARAVVARWKRGESLYILPLRRKVLLIQEMLSGATFDADERSILDLLIGATDSEFPAIISAVGLSNLQSAIDFSEHQEFDSLYARRSGITETPDQTARRERGTFSDETVLAAQPRFTNNAMDAHRLNCILIIRELAPQLFAHEPQLAERVRVALAGMQGQNLKMTELGQIMSDLGLVSGREPISFNNGNGNQEPTAMQRSAWDTIMGMVGNVQGWHVFGLAVFNGYHSVTVMVEKRADSTHVYWADQWRIDPGDDFNQRPGSVSGFRLYDQAGFDRFLTEKTREWWNEVHSEHSDCGTRATQRGRDWDTICRWNASTLIWKFRSRLEQTP